jgi:hypothetical protein
MEHWFDSFVRRAAGGGTSTSRRGVLVGLFATAGASVVGGGALAALAESDPDVTDPTTLLRRLDRRFSEEARSSTEREGCAIRITGTRRSQRLSAIHGRLSMSQDAVFDLSSGTSTKTATIRHDTTLVLRVQSSVNKSGAGNLTLTYGPAVRGARHVSITSQDGHTLIGTMDGRTFHGSRNPGARGRRSFSPDSIRFADGREHPQLQVDREITEGLPNLIRELAAAKRFCPPVNPASRRAPRAPRPTRRTDVDQPPAGGPRPRGALHSNVRSFANNANSGALRRAAFDWHLPNANSVNDPACEHCFDTCNDEDGGCVGSALVTTILSAGAGAAGVFTCHAEWVGCLATCHLPHHGCCPTPCGTGGDIPAALAGDCCSPNESCMLPAQKTCCPAGQHVCRGTCCERGILGCASDGFCGCPNGQTACGDECCEPGKVCCGGTCCDANKCNNGVCSVVPKQADCGGQTCGPFDNCCGGRCCTGTCVNNSQCCPPGPQTCGPACCAPGQFCTDSARGICSNRRSCPAGQSACETVMPGSPPGATTQMCCPTGTSCCLGNCCPPGYECCAGGCEPTCVR